MWSITIPGLALSTGFSVEYDQAREQASVCIQYVDVGGEQKSCTLPLSPDQLKRVVNVLAGWPFK